VPGTDWPWAGRRPLAGPLARTVFTGLSGHASQSQSINFVYKAFHALLNPGKMIKQ